MNVNIVILYMKVKLYVMKEIIIVYYLLIIKFIKHINIHKVIL